MRKIISVVCTLFLFIFAGCAFNSNRDDYSKIGKISYIPFDTRIVIISSDEELDRDVRIIPDKYNTGIEPGITLNKIPASVGYYEINGVKIFHRELTDKNGNVSYEYQIIGNKNPSLAKETLIEGYDFSDCKFTFNAGNAYKEKKTIVFKNCKFRNLLNAGDNNPFYLVFENCTFLGNVSEVNILMDHCRLEKHLSDAGNPLKNYIVKDSYICDLVVGSLASGEVHIDGFQSFGRKGITGENIYLDNVRFEVPSINFGASKASVNACIMFQLEYGSIHHVYYKNLVCNGGGKWYPIYLKKNPNYPSYDINMVNVSVSNIYKKIFYPVDYHTEAFVKNVYLSDKLFVSSVWKDSDGTHIICSNDTNEDKTLTVKTDKGEFIFEMPHCPSDFALSGDNSKNPHPNESLTDAKGKSYKEYTFSDMPFDVDCKILTDVRNIECYDGETRIRKVEF